MEIITNNTIKTDIFRRETKKTHQINSTNFLKYSAKK